MVGEALVVYLGFREGEEDGEKGGRAGGEIGRAHL